MHLLVMPLGSEFDHAEFCCISVPKLLKSFTSPKCVPNPSATLGAFPLKVGSMFQKTRLSFIFVPLVFIVASSSNAQINDTGQQISLVAGPIDESELVRLAGNTRPEAIATNDRGRVDDSFRLEHMLLQLRRSSLQEAALQGFIDQLHDPGSANFHKWITPDEFGRQFGLAQADLDAITGWLQTHGLEVNTVYPNRVLIDFSGTAAQVQEAFRTEIHELSVGGVHHIANVADPQIPAALTPAVLGIAALHDFMPRSMLKMRPNYTGTDPYGDPVYAVVPGDLATIYNLNPLFKAGYSGKGQTIAVIENTNVYNASDWSTFRKTFGLSSYSSGSFTTVHPAPRSGANNCSNPGVVAIDGGEAILDAEWASAAAPNAAIELASCKDTTTTFGGLIALQNLINESATPPAVVSISYGACEAENGASANATYNSTYQQATAEGVSIFVAAGDSGAAVCDPDTTDATHGIGVNAFASTPYNVAVGGTDFGDTYAGTNSTYWNSNNTSTYASAKSYVPEIPWNDSCASVLIATYIWFTPTYGPDSLCNLGVALTTVAGGGGPSACATGAPATSGVVSGTCKGYAKPSWQSGVLGLPTDGLRDLPDLSLFAADGIWSHAYVFCWSDTANGGLPCTGAPGGWSGGGGTSFAAPIMAGIQALVNQKTVSRQGNPNYIYYKLAAAEYGATGKSACNSTLGNAVASTCIFHDVTEGDTDIPCTGSHSCYDASDGYGVLSKSDSSYRIAFGTATGWDFASGIGTINATNLVNNWTSVTK
jgi:subtilase family serine protease